jgi:hypothetical protein
MKEKFQLTISQWKRRIITSQVVRVGGDVFCDSISETKNLLPTISRRCRLYTEDIASMATHKDKFLPTRVLVVKLENRSIRLQRASVDIPSSRHVKKRVTLCCFVLFLMTPVSNKKRKEKWGNKVSQLVVHSVILSIINYVWNRTDEV